MTKNTGHHGVVERARRRAHAASESGTLEAISMTTTPSPPS